MQVCGKPVHATVTSKKRHRKSYRLSVLTSGNTVVLDGWIHGSVYTLTCRCVLIKGILIYLSKCVNVTVKKRAVTTSTATTSMGNNCILS